MSVLLTRDAEPSVLVAYLASKPTRRSRLSCRKTLNRVGRKKELDVFFDMEAEDAAAAKRELARLEEAIELAIEDEEQMARSQRSAQRLY